VEKKQKERARDMKNFMLDFVIIAAIVTAIFLGIGYFTNVPVVYVDQYGESLGCEIKGQKFGPDSKHCKNLEEYEVVHVNGGAK
jgi:hypothetical protein